MANLDRTPAAPTDAVAADPAGRGDPAALLAAAEQELAAAEQELARVRRALHDTQRTGHIGTWTWFIREGRVEWSPEIYRIFGIDESSFSGSLAEVIAGAIHPDDRAAVEASNREVAEAGRAAPLEYRVVRPDGSERVVWAEAAAMIRDAAGEPVELRGIVQDITERARTERALRESELRWKFAVEGAGDGLWDWDVATDRVWYSSRWKTMLGYAEEEVGDALDAWATRVHPDDRQRTFADVQAHLDGQVSAYVNEHRLRHRDGSWVWVLDRGLAVDRDDDGRPTRVIGTHADVSARVAAEEALRSSEARYRTLVEGFPGVVYSFATDRGSVFNSNQVATVIGYSAAELAADPMRWTDSIHPEDLPRVDAAVARADDAVPFELEYRIRHRDGTWRWVEDRSIRYREADGGLVIDGFILDVTERRQAAQEHDRLIEQLNLASHLESLGRLAGGVAHDFNNMLGAIIGHAELALDALAADAPARRDLLEIQGAARRSAELTRQLLAFARRQAVTPSVVDVNAHVRGMLTMLRRLIGEDIILDWRPDARAPAVFIDPSQLDQVLANLCINARDAIGGPGRITIETGLLDVEAGAARQLRGASIVAPGRYTVIRVTDDGCGMDEETMTHVFEPFFTTKGVGQGTGLGLATVYGVVEQNRGGIEVESRPGAGSTFRILLPSQDPVSPAPDSPGELPAARGGETILVTEDEPLLLALSIRLLERAGYRVLAAPGPAEAIRIASAQPGAIDLLLTDVVMPGMNGRDLAVEVARRQPGIRRLFMSGYTADIVKERGGGLEEHDDVLHKPFSGAELAAAVRAALDGASRRGEPSA